MSEIEKAIEDVTGGKIEIDGSYLPGWYTCASCGWQNKKLLMHRELLTECPNCGGDLYFHTEERMTHYKG
jgi:hypothetical protein